MVRVLGRFTGRKVAIVGMGRSNLALCRYLLKEGAFITCFDRKSRQEMEDTARQLEQMGVELRLGPGYLETLPSFQWIFLTPGMKKNLPEIVLARQNGAVISTEIDLFLERCKAEVYGVTGSAGKTTTCTLLGMMLRESFPDRKVYVGGNIGSVLIEEVDSIPSDALVVLELSSFQLELVSRSPRVSMILNIRPNHLDVHDSFEDYVEAKKRIFKFQGSGDWCVLNLDDPLTSSIASECPGHVGFFTLSRHRAQSAISDFPGTCVAWLEGDNLMVYPGYCRAGHLQAGYQDTHQGTVLAVRTDFLVPGEHNVANALGASLLATLAGATPEAIRRAIRSFTGVEHRIEFVREFRGIRFYNDSIATSPDRTEALLEAVQGPLVLIMGGYDKGLSFDELAEKVVRRASAVVTLGKTAEKIERALVSAWSRARTSGKQGEPEPGPCGSHEAMVFQEQPDIVRAKSLDEAVELAAAKAMPGWSVVLSPACASFDMFSNYEERGRKFKEIVRNLG